MSVDVHLSKKNELKLNKYCREANFDTMRISQVSSSFPTHRRTYAVNFDLLHFFQPISTGMLSCDWSKLNIPLPLEVFHSRRGA